MSGDEPGLGKRGADRRPMSIEVAFRRSGGHGFRVRAFDLSPKGCKVEFVERPALGERVWVKFDKLEALQGTIRWVEGHIGGVEFDRPLHEAVFGLLASQDPDRA